MSHSITKVEPDGRYKAQCGSIVIPAAAALLVCVILLGAAQLGLYFSIKREAQNAVDLAALNNVVMLDNYQLEGAQAANCNPEMLDYAKAYLQETTSFTGAKADGLTVYCKQVTKVGDEYIDQPGGTDYNAIDVSLSLEAKPYALFSTLGLETIQATATAYLPSIDDFLAQQRFSVEYVGAQVNEGLLELVLTTVGLRPDQVRVLSSSGLADVRLTPSGLLQALGLPVDVGGSVGSPTDLVHLPHVGIADVLDAAVSVLQQNGLAGVDLGLLQDTINVLLNVPGFNTKVPLFGEGGFLQIAKSGSVEAALGTKISWGELLNTSVFLANSENLINIDLGLNLGSLLKAEGKVLLVEPPASAPLVVGNRASHANARIYLHLTALAGLVDLPVILELGQGSARVEDVGFNRATATGHVDFSVNGSLLNVCMGRFTHALFSAENSCSTSEDFAKVERHPIVNLLGILPINAKLALSVLSRDDANNSNKFERMKLEGLGPYKHKAQTANLNLPDVVTAVADGIVAGVLADIVGSSSGSMTSAQREAVATKLVAEHKSLMVVVGSLNFSASQFEDYQQRIVRNPLLGTLGSTLGIVGGVLGTVLSGLGDVLCGLADIGGKGFECRVAMVKDLVLSSPDAQLEYIVTTLFTSVLQPLLVPLNLLLDTVLKSVLGLLGLELGVVEISIDEFSSQDQFEGVLIP